jgi:hypothetical protein
MVPLHVPTYRASKKIFPRKNELSIFEEPDPNETPVKTGQRVYNDLKFTMDPLLREDRSLRYHILAPMSLKEQPIWEPTIHKHVKHFTDNIKPDWFDHEGIGLEDPLDERYKDKILTSNDEAATFIKYVSIDRRYPKQSKKRTEGLRGKNSSIHGIESIMRHDYLYAKNESNSPNKQNTSGFATERVRHRDLSSPLNNRIQTETSTGDTQVYDTPYYLKKRQKSSEKDPSGTRTPRTDRSSIIRGSDKNREETPRYQQNITSHRSTSSISRATPKTERSYRR